MIKKARFIQPGDGSYGYYSTSVLEAAANTRVFPKGTKVFWNHAGIRQAISGSRNLDDHVGVTVEDAKFKKHSTHGHGLYTAINIFESAIAKVKEKGLELSIFASADRRHGKYTADDGTVKEGFYIKKLQYSPLNSIDFVAYGGAGGQIITESYKEQQAFKIRKKNKLYIVEQALLYGETNIMSEELVKELQEKLDAQTAQLNAMETREKSYRFDAAVTEGLSVHQISAPFHSLAKLFVYDRYNKTEDKAKFDLAVTFESFKEDHIKLITEQLTKVKEESSGASNFNGFFAPPQSQGDLIPPEGYSEFIGTFK